MLLLLLLLLRLLVLLVLLLVVVLKLMLLLLLLLLLLSYTLLLMRWKFICGLAIVCATTVYIYNTYIIACDYTHNTHTQHTLDRSADG